LQHDTLAGGVNGKGVQPVAMTSESYEPPPILPPPPPKTAPFRVPADYYSTDLSTVRPLFPRWVAYGCGTAAILGVLLLVLIGGWLQGGGATVALDWMFGQLHTELKPMMAKDVTPAQKAQLESEITTFRANMKSGKLTFAQAQPILKLLQDQIGDQKVTGAELDRLNGALHTINGVAAKGRPSGK
jgi:hypothetical protein